MDNESLNRTLREWTTDARIEQARKDRQSRQWQTRFAAEEARFGGLLVDLYERNEAISLTTESGRLITGVITELGADFVCITNLQGTHTYLRLPSITSIELNEPGGGQTTPSLRVIDEQRDLETLTGELAEEKAHIRFVTKNSNDVRSGTLRSAGVDMLTIEIAGSPNRTLFIAADQLSEIAIPA